MIRQRAASWLSRHLVTPLHASFVSSSRIETLTSSFVQLLPEGSLQGLDVGCGSGELAARIQEHRHDVRLTGVDVLVREKAFIKVHAFDGHHLPFPDKSFDFVIISDVLHHTDDPEALLKECARVVTGFVLIKDHICDSPLDKATLSFMDWVGNRGYDVSLPYNYLSAASWQRAFRQAGLRIDQRIDQLSLYPQPFSLLFDRSLHFVARLSVS